MDLRIDRDRLVELAVRLVSVPSFTGSEQDLAELFGDELLDKCKPIAGTPNDCIAAIEEYREAGCTHVMLELWGDRRHEQIRLFGERVLPAVRG